MSPSPRRRKPKAGEAATPGGAPDPAAKAPAPSTKAPAPAAKAAAPAAKAPAPAAKAPASAAKAPASAAKAPAATQPPAGVHGATLSAEVLEAQRDFIADAAHALRSPLTALKLQVQLAERARDGASRSAAFAKLHERLDRVNRLVNQLLTLSRQERGQPQPLDPVDLGEIAHGVLSDHQPLAQERGVSLTLVRAQNAGAKVRGNADELAILLANLVDNALRHTPIEGHIQVLTRKDAEGVLLEVRDSGEGIPPEHRERVFDRFYRAPGAGTVGSGLGLAIVKAIAFSHQASVRLDEADIGGLRVEVRFPSAR